MGYVFISYSTKNQAFADAVKDLFTKNNIKTWMAPGDIPVGRKYPEIITKALRDCSCLVLLLSDASQNSIWVPKEVERAINYKKPIVPLQLESVTLNDEFELYISTDQIIAIRKIDETSEEIQKLLTCVRCYTDSTPLAEEKL